MKEFFRSFFASFLAIIVSGILLVVLVIAIIASVSRTLTEREHKKMSGDVLVLDLTKRIHEQGQNNSLAMLSDVPSYEAGLYDILKAIDHAQTDDDIKGILLKLGPTANGWATLQQLQLALKDFRSAGKFIYAYGERITQGAYFAATAADSIYLNPAGGIDLKGFSTSMPFFKGTLDKLEIEPEIFYAGKFKSATEPFRADKMSEPNRIQVKAFQDDMWEQFLAAAASYIHIGRDTIQQWAMDGTIQFPADAARLHMVAGLRYWDEVEQRIRIKTKRTDREDVRYIKMNDYVATIRSQGRTAEDKIAVVIAEGDITDGEQDNDREIASKEMCEEIRKVAEDDHVKAVVLRVNSPGGSALASEVILRELILLKQKKHVVVSMGDYAASGGYYISCMADSIFALPNTITGSIGVFGMMFSIDKLMKNKFGITFDGVKNTPYADLPTASRPLTPEEMKRMQASVDTIYAQFKARVATGRRLALADVDSIAQGRVWTGDAAMSIGLVDGLGGIERAVSSVAALAKLKDYRVVTYPEPADKFSSLMRRFSSNTQTKAMVQQAMKEELGEGYEWYGKVKDLVKMNGKVMMAMPSLLRTE